MFGDRTVDLIESVAAAGVSRMAVLIRHSAREYEPGRHDLLNPLTDEGRAIAHSVGERLPKQMKVRGYASPPERCMETAEQILAGHSVRGGTALKHRAVEALGVFYALDQIKMWKGMRAAGGLSEYLQAWFAGDVPPDAMMPPDIAARLVCRVVAEKLRDGAIGQPGSTGEGGSAGEGGIASESGAQLDLCVSHDMTVALVMDRLLGQRAGDYDVEYLDAIVAYEAEGALWLRSCHAPPRKVDLSLLV